MRPEIFFASGKHSQELLRIWPMVTQGSVSYQYLKATEKEYWALLIAEQHAAPRPQKVGQSFAVPVTKRVMRACLEARLALRGGCSVSMNPITGAVRDGCHTTARWRGRTHDLVLLVENLTVMTCIHPREDLAQTRFPLYDKTKTSTRMRNEKKEITKSLNTE